jgi:putative ABC transport system permease protein
LIAGMALSLALSKVLAHWSAEQHVSTGSPLLLTASALALILVAAVACLIPARRAAGVSPMIAIRAE